MRQVPTYGVIGAGRMARHFIYYLQLLSIPFLQWSRSQNDLSDLDNLIQRCNPILILIKDDAIEPFISTYPALNEKTLVHFSGALTTALAYGAHPLMTFANEVYTLEKYQKIPFIIDTQQLAFSDLMPAITNPHYIIKPEMKTYYHCLCTMSGNFTTLLWQKMFKEMEAQFKIPKEMVYPYMEKIQQNLLHDHLNALTGPFVRNDKNTITKHLAALGDDKFKAVYEGFLAMYFDNNDEKK
jgi:2-dehydropantoate 2-reductase